MGVDFRDMRNKLIDEELHSIRGFFRVGRV